MEKENHEHLLDFVDQYDQSLIDQPLAISYLVQSANQSSSISPETSSKPHHEDHFAVERSAGGLERNSECSIHSEDIFKSAEDGLWRSETSLMESCSDLQSKEKLYWDTIAQELDTSLEDFYNTSVVDLSSSLNAGYSGSFRKRKVSCYEDALRVLGVGMEGRPSPKSALIDTLSDPLPRSEKNEDPCELIEKLGSIKLSRISSISHSDPELHASPKLSSRIDHSHLLAPAEALITKSQEIEVDTGLSQFTTKPKSPTQRNISEPYIRGHFPETLELQFKQLMEGVITRAIESSSEHVQGRESKDNSEGLAGLNRLVVMLEQLNQARKDNRYWRKRCRYLENKYSCPGAIGGSDGKSPERTDLKDQELKRHREQMLYDYFQAKPLAKKKFSLTSESELKKVPTDPTKELKTVEMRLKDDKMERKKSKKFQTKWEQVKKVFWSARQEALAKKEMTAEWASAAGKPDDKRLLRTGRQHTVVGPLMLSEPQKSVQDDDGEDNLDSPKSINSEPAVEFGAMAAEETSKVDDGSVAKNRLSLSDFPNIDSYAESTAKLQDILNFQKQQQFAINYPDVLQHEKVGVLKTTSTPSARATEHISDDQKQVQFAFPDPQRSESKRPKKTDTASHLNVKLRDESVDHHFSDSDKYPSSSTYQLPLGKFSKSDKDQLDKSWDSATLKGFQQHLKPGIPGDDSKIRSSGKVTWEKVKDLIHTRKGSFRRRRSKKQQDTYLDLIPQRSADADLDSKFPDVADITRSNKGEVQSLKPKGESVFRRESSNKLKKSNSKSKEIPASDDKPQRKVSRSEENFTIGIPKCGSSPGLAELTPMLSRSRSDKIRRDRSTSNEEEKGKASSLTTPVRRRADTYTTRQAEKRQLTRAQPLKDQKHKTDSKTFSSKDSDDQDHHHYYQQYFDQSPSAGKTAKPSNISLAEIYTCTSLSSTINVVNLSSSYRPPPSPLPRKDPSKPEDMAVAPISSPPIAMPVQGMPTSRNLNLKVPMLHLALSTDSLQSTSSSGFTRTSSTLSTNTPGLSPSYRDDCPSSLSKVSSFSAIEVKDDNKSDGLSTMGKERPKSALVESVECEMIDKKHSSRSEIISQPTDSSVNDLIDMPKADIQVEARKAENDNIQEIKDISEIKESLSTDESLQHIQDSSVGSSPHLPPADSDKAALLSRLVSASEILFRSIGESSNVKSKPIHGRKSFLLLKDLMERLINELDSKQDIPTTPTDEHLKTVESCVTSSETEQEESFRDLRTSSTQTTPTIETTTSMDKPMLMIDNVDNSSSIEDQKLMKTIQIMFKNLPKTRRFSDSAISSPRFLFQIPTSPHPSRDNLSSDPTPLKTGLELKELDSFMASFRESIPDTPLSQPCTPLRKIPARQIPYIRLQSQYDNVFTDASQLRPHSTTNVEGDFFQFLEKENLHEKDLKIQNIGIQVTKSSDQDLSNKEFENNKNNEKISDLIVEPFNTNHRTLSDSGISESVFYSHGSSRNQLSGQISTDLVQIIDSAPRSSPQEKRGKTCLLPPGNKLATRSLIDKMKDSPKLTIYTRSTASTSTSEPFMAVGKSITTAEVQHQAASNLVNSSTPPAVRCSFDVPHKNGRSKSQDYGSKQSSEQSKLDINVVSSETDTVESVKKLTHVSSTPYIGKPSSIYTESLNLMEKPNLFIGSDQCGIGYLATLSEPLIYVDPSDGINTKITLPSIYALNEPSTASQSKDESTTKTTKPASASDPLTHKSKTVPDSSTLSINSSDFFQTRPKNDDQLMNIDDQRETIDQEQEYFAPKTRRPLSSDSDVPTKSGYPIDVDVMVDINPIKPSLKSKVKSSGELEKTQTKKPKITFSKVKPEKLQEERTRLSLKERFLSSPKFLRIKFCKTKPSRDSVVEEDDEEDEEDEDNAEEGKAEKAKDESKKKKRSRSLPSTSSNIFSRFFEREFFQRSRRFFRRNRNK